MKYARIERIETIAPPATKETVRKNIACLFLATLTITKYIIAVNKYRTKEIIASDLLMLKSEDKSKARVKRITGRSKGVLLSVIFPAKIILIANKASAISAAPAKTICLGKINGSCISVYGSIVSVEITIGKAKNRIPRIIKERFPI